MGLEDRVIAVTGGTRGVGRSVVARLCALGARVVFQGRDKDAAQEVIDLAASAGTTPVFVPGDLYDPSSARELVATAIERFGGLHGAVGNGMTSAPPARLFLEMDPADFASYFHHGALHRLYLAHAAAREMAAAGYGKIVLITSDAGRMPTPSESMIGATAASLIFATRALGRELSRDGVRVNTVAITLTKGTPSFERVQRRRAEGGTETPTLLSAFDTLAKRMPFGLGEPDEVAGIVAFYLSPATDGISGSTVSVNRGAYFPSYS